jgi:hypothetical protein
MTRASGTYQQLPTTAYNTIGSYRSQFGAMSTVFNTALTRSADSGQVNFSTITTPSTALGRDFEVFALTDSLQTSKPVYLRLDYYASTTLSGYLGATVGTASDGAGNVTGIGAGNIVLLPNYGSGANGLTRLAYASTDGSYLALWFNLQTAANTYAAAGGYGYGDTMGAIIVERTRDADGTPNGNGFTIWRWQQSSDGPLTAAGSTYAGMTCRSYDATAWQPPTTLDTGAALPFAGQTSSYYLAGTASAYPAYTYAGLTPQGASKALMIGWAGDYSPKTAVPLTHYGATMTFLAMGPHAVLGAPYMSTNAAAAVRAGLCPLLRWE